ncbi:glycosyltransferase family 2 protein [Actinomycetales bacterium SN12]|nr:glycosyltransferase family 2 protein [Actinomycetales bacterium SN12]
MYRRCDCSARAGAEGSPRRETTTKYERYAVKDVAVLVATYKRPEHLRDLLHSLEIAYEVMSFDLIVIDNDPEGTGGGSCEDSALNIQYAIEPAPGIAAARNRALRLAMGKYAFVAFVDDDEWVSPTWLADLVGAQSRYSADVVSGPVTPVLPSNAPKWARWGQFFSRPAVPSGSRTRWPATNNSLVRSAAIARLDKQEFAEEFSITGGSDTEFFWRLELSGATFVWCNEAEVFENVLPSRLSVKWLWRRGRRLGNVSSRMLILKGKSRASVILLGAFRAIATPGIVLLALLRRTPWGPAAMNFPKAVGMITASMGTYVREYQRQ